VVEFGSLIADAGQRELSPGLGEPLGPEQLQVVPFVSMLRRGHGERPVPVSRTELGHSKKTALWEVPTKVTHFWQ
jgi:hypothetical protein